MSSFFSLTVKTTEDNKTTTSELFPGAGGNVSGSAPDAWGYCRALSGYFGAAALGAKSINILYDDGLSSGFATGTITFTGAPANNDTVTIAGVVITFKTSGATGSQVNIGGSQANAMANLVTFINANGSANNLVGLVNAVLTSSTVITIFSDYPGLVGNLITMSKSAANISAITSPLAGGAIVNQSAPPVSAGL